MGGANKHHNFNFDGGAPNIPEYTGDRYFGQDRARDFWYQVNKAGEIGLMLMLGEFGESAYVGGGAITVVDPTHMDIPPQAAVVIQNQDFPDDWSGLPSSPPTVTSQPVKIPLLTPDLSNQLITGATLDGATVNYIKIARAETDDKSRIRAKTLGSYYFEKGDSYTLTFGSAAPASNEVAVASFIGDGSTFLTITMEQNWYERILDVPTLLPTQCTKDPIDIPVGSGKTSSTVRMNADGSVNRFVIYEAGSPSYTLTLYEVTVGDRVSMTEVASTSVNEATGGFDVCLIDDNNFVTFNTSAGDLRWYRESGGSISQIGNTGSVPGTGGTKMTKFRSIADSVMLIHDSNTDMSVYTFDGTDFSQTYTTTLSGGLASPNPLAYIGNYEGDDYYVISDDDPETANRVIIDNGASIAEITTWSFPTGTGTQTTLHYAGVNGYIIGVGDNGFDLFKVVWTEDISADFGFAIDGQPMSTVTDGFKALAMPGLGLIVYNNSTDDTLETYQLYYTEIKN